MKTKSLMASFAIILITLSTVGFAYSSWRDSVVIEVNAQMGEFIVGILVDPLPDYWGPDPVVVWETTNNYPEDGKGAPNYWEEGGFVPKPWVCDTLVDLNDFRTSVHHDPTQTVAHSMYITITNAYPQYDAHIEFLLKNAGTIPAHIRTVFDYAIVTQQGMYLRDLELIDWGWVYSAGVWTNFGELYDPMLDAVVINWMLLLEAEQTGEYPQLEPCVEHYGYIYFDFKQDAEECHTYYFGFHIDAIQWNMDYEWGMSP